MNKDKKEKRIRVLEVQKARDRNRLVRIKKHIKPVNKILEQIK